ncbi:dihydrofolate reductase [Streptomyces roseicoloratus]|uniref:Dihydrofolate reductase n=1 Tax=Streptomyces roseicoloratus TaxID=2508722 RepID=A0ABY9S3J2_9ACTN|nr:dihydrofolate reductase [Streptomyces roseicoloratus]WMX48987.1 dihydrofolate reductase [Streptomyces roseicoloratus]
MGVGLIWAQAVDGVIGAANTIPWRLPEDMAHFKATTLGRPVIMGRRTWDSLPARFRPLPGRRNIVVTRDPEWAAEGAERAGSVPEALALVAEPATTGASAAAADVPAGAGPAVWVMGGGEIYRAALPYATTVSVTEIDTTVEGGDTYAPALDPTTWTVTEEKASDAGTGTGTGAGPGWATSTTGLRYRIRTFVRG